jgi:LysM repeat protein
MSSDTTPVSSPDPTGSHASTTASQHLTPLKAKELSLDSVKSGGQPTSAHAGQPAAHVNLAHHTAPLHHGDATTSSAGKHGQLLDKSVEPTGTRAHSLSQPARKISEITTHHSATPRLAERHHLLGNNSGHKDLIARSTPKDVTASGKQIGNSDAHAVAAKSATYTIRAGDCLWNIARNHLGSGFKWHDLYQLNHDALGSNPSLLHTGTALKLPGMSNEIAQAGANSGNYVVKSGDCLWNIAKDQMHDATKWGDIFKANNDIIGANPRLIMPGQELALPRGSLLATAPTPSPALEHVAQAASAPNAPPSISASHLAPAHIAHIQHVVPADASTSIASTAPVHSLIQKMPPSFGQPVSTPAAHSAPSVHVGPGAAAAATLRFGNGLGAMPAQAGLRPTIHPVVDGAVSSDLASFIAQGK